MICPKCGFDDDVIREYCINCGTKLEFRMGEQEAILAREKKREHQALTAKRVRRWLVFGLAVMTILFTARAAFRAVHSESIEAYIDPPQVGLTAPVKLPITLSRLPVPEPGVRQARKVDALESDILKQMTKSLLQKAPVHRMKDGSKLQGFIVRREAGKVTIFTAEGEKDVLAANIASSD